MTTLRSFQAEIDQFAHAQHAKQMREAKEGTSVAGTPSEKEKNTSYGHTKEEKERLKHPPRDVFGKEKKNGGHSGKEKPSLVDNVIALHKRSDGKKDKEFHLDIGEDERDQELHNAFGGGGGGGGVDDDDDDNSQPTLEVSCRFPSPFLTPNHSPPTSPSRTSFSTSLQPPTPLSVPSSVLSSSEDTAKPSSHSAHIQPQNGYIAIKNLQFKRLEEG